MSIVTPFKWLRSHPYYVLAAVFFCVVAVPFLRKTDSQFDNVYLRAAARLQAGKDIYPLQDGYLYPPLMAWMSIPFTYLPQTAARVIWLGINFGCLSLLWIWSWRLAGGGRLNGTTDWKELLICGLGLLCAFRYGVDCLQNQQTDIVVAALVVGGCVALGSPSQKLGAKRGLIIAATCFGIAAGMKCTALLFAPYLLWRGRWLGALWVGVLAVGLNLLPNLASTAEHGLWLNEWMQRYLSVFTRSEHSPGVWGSAVTLNQSWSGALYRWFATTWTWDGAGFQVGLRPEPMSPTVLKVLVYGSELVMLAGAAWIMARKAPRGGSGLNEHGLECAMVLVLMVLLSPMSSKPHFCTLLLPAWLLARLALTQRSWFAALCLALAIGAGALTIKDLATANLASVAMWYGGVTWSAVFLLTGCGHALWRMRQVQAATIDTRMTTSAPSALAA